MPAGKPSTENLTGTQKVAIFLLALGKEFTTSFFKKLDERTVKEIGKHMTDISVISSGVLNAVMDEFIYNFENDVDLCVSGKSFLQEVVAKSFDETKARQICKSLGSNEGKVPFEELAFVPSEKLVNILKGEHPQTVALILSYLPQEKSAEILGLIPEDSRCEIAIRIAHIGHVQDDILMDLDEVIGKDITGMGTTRARKFDGAEKLADILNKVDSKTEETILSFVEKEDEDLADVIRQKMFVFEDLLDVDDRGFREILQNVENTVLIKALKTASEEMRQKIFKNLSERAAEMLKEDMEVLGLVRLKEVEENQQKIIKIAKKLESEGRIVIRGKGKEDVFV